MGLEAATLIHQLDANNPVSSDSKGQGDDHLRLIKTCLLGTFANVDGAVTASHTEMNRLAGLTVNLSLINPLTAFAINSFTPTLTQIANATSIVNGFHRYIRFNDLVLVIGAYQCSCAVGQSTVAVSLPIASNFTSAVQAAGGGGFLGATIGGVYIGTEFSAADRLLVTFTSQGVATHFVNYTAVYPIL